MLMKLILGIFIQVCASRRISGVERHYRDRLSEKLRPLRYLTGAKPALSVSQIYEEKKKDDLENFKAELDLNPFGIHRDDLIGNDSIDEEPRDFVPDSFVYSVKNKLGIKMEPMAVDEDDFEENSPSADSAPEESSDNDQSESDKSENDNDSLLDIEYSDIPDVLTPKYLAHNITAFHSSVRKCLTLHMRANPGNEKPFNQIIDDCIGPDAIYMKRYYNDIVFLIRKYLTDSIMNKLSIGFCDKEFSICVEFYKTIWLFAEMNYDINASLNANGEPLEELLGVQKLKFLYSLSLEFISDYQKLRDQVRIEREMISHLLQVNREQYEMEFVPPKHEADDNDNLPSQNKGHGKRKKEQVNNDEISEADSEHELVGKNSEPTISMLVNDFINDDSDNEKISEPETPTESLVDTRRENLNSKGAGSQPMDPAELDRINEQAHALLHTKKKGSKVNVPKSKF
jgi:hypothetical protein